MADVAFDVVTTFSSTGVEAGARRAGAGLDGLGSKARGAGASIKGLESRVQQLLLALLSIQGIRQSINIVKQFEQMDRGFKIILKSAEAAAAEVALVTRESDRLGVNLRQTGIALSQFIAASKGTLPLEQLHDTFFAVTQGLAQMGAPAEQTQRALLALQQMASKGTVSMEELRQQLGEALPGAMQISAKGMGLSVQQFTKLVEKGDLLTKDFLPKFTTEFKKAFGIDTNARIENTQATLTRFGNAVEQIQLSFGKGFLSGFAEGFSDLGRALSSQELLRAANELGRDIGHAVSVAAKAVSELVRNFEALKPVIGAIIAYKLAAWAMTAAAELRAMGTAGYFAAGPIGALAAALAALGLAVNAGIRAWDAALQAQIDYYTNTNQAAGAVMALARAVSQSQAIIEETTIRAAAAARLQFTQVVDEQRKQIARLEEQQSSLWMKLAGGWASADLAGKLVDAKQKLADAEAQLSVLDKASQRLPEHILKFGDAITVASGKVADFSELQVTELRGLLGELDAVLKSKQAQALTEEELAKLTATRGEIESELADRAKKAAKEATKAGESAVDLIAKQRRAAEAAESILEAEAAGGAQRQRTILVLEAQAKATEALQGIENLSRATREALLPVMTQLILREKAAQAAREATAAETERLIGVDAVYREALAALTDARAGDSVSSRALTAQLEAESIARAAQREGDLEYIRILRERIEGEQRAIRSIEQMTALELERVAHGQEMRLLLAQLADAQTGLGLATAKVNLATQIENVLRKEGITAGSVEAVLREAEIRQRAALEAGVRAQIATEERWLAVRKEGSQILAEISDWKAQSAAAAAYGSEVAGIIERTGRLSGATRELELRERVLAAVRAEAENGPVAPARLLAIEAEIRAQDAAIQGVLDYRAALELAAYAHAPIQEAWKATKDTITDVVADLVTGVEVDWKQLLQRMLQLWVRTLIEMVARARAAQLASTALGSAGGGGGGNVSGGGFAGLAVNAFQASGLGAGSAGAAGGWGGISASVWGAAAGAALVGAFYAVFKHQEDRHNAIRYNSGASFGSYDGRQLSTAGGKLGETAAGIQRGMLDIVSAIQETGGVYIESLATVSVEVRNDKKAFRAFLDGELLGTFKTANEAIVAAMRAALLSADYSRELDPAVQQVIQRGDRFQTPEQFAAALRAVQSLVDATSGLSQIEIEMRAFPVTLGKMRDALRAAGVSIDQVQRLTGAAAVSMLQTWSDQITGRQQTDEERAAQQRRQATLFNAQLAIYRLQIEAEKAQIEARLRLMDARVRGGILEVDAEREILMARTQIQQMQVEGDTSFLGAQLDFVERRGALFSFEAGLMGSALDTQTEALRRQREALAAILASLPTAIDLDSLELPRASSGGGGGGGRRKELVEELREIVASALPDLTRGLVEARERIDALRERVARLGPDAALAAQALAILEDQLRMQAQEAFLTLAERMAQMLGDEQTLADLAEIRYDLEKAQFALEIARLQELGFLSKEQVERLQALYDRLPEDLPVTGGSGSSGASGPSALDVVRGAINDGLDSLRDLAAAIHDLQRQAKEAGEKVDFGPLFAQVRDQLYLTFGDRLSGFLERYYSGAEGFEQFRMNLEQVRFDLELANMRLQFALLQEMGILTEAQIKQIQGVFDWIEKHPPQLIVPGAGGGFDPGSYSDAADEAARAMEEALDLLHQYQEDGLSPFQRDLLRLNEDFEKIRATLGNTPEVIKAYTDALARLKDQYLSDIREYLSEVQQSELSPLTLQQRFSAAMREYQSILGAVNSGDLSQASELPRIADQLLQLFAQITPQAGAAYRAFYDQIMRELALAAGLPQPASSPGLENVAPFQVHAIPRQVADAQNGARLADAVNAGNLAQVSELRDLRKEAASTVREVRGLRRDLRSEWWRDRKVV